jgi:hypothetical protein
MKKRDDTGQLPLPLEPRPLAVTSDNEAAKPRLTLVSNSAPIGTSDEQTERDEEASALARIVDYSRSLGW